MAGPRRGAVRLGLLATILLTALIAPAAQAVEHAPAPGRGEVLIILHREGHDDGRPLLRYTLVATLGVQASEAGREVAAPLPDDAAMDDFTLAAGVDTPEPTTTDVETRGGREWAVATWEEAGPAIDDWVPMRLEARRGLDNAQRIGVEWGGLPENLTSVRIFLPATHLPLVDAAYAPAREESTGSLIGWNLTEPPSGEVRFTIRAIEPGTDPALAAPPIRLGGFLVLLGLAVAAAIVWFAGKKLDARLRRD